MGPSAQYVSAWNGGRPGTRPNGGLKPTTPQKEDGIRIEPPMSDPVASTVSPAASTAPAPPDEPPGVAWRFHGLRVTPHSLVWVKAAMENSGVADRACTTAPAACTRSTNGWVTSAI